MSTNILAKKIKDEPVDLLNLVAVSYTKFNQKELDYFVKQKGYHHYQIRSDNQDISEPVTIEPHVISYHYCDVILREPINDFGDNRAIELSEEDKALIREDMKTIKRYFK